MFINQLKFAAFLAQRQIPKNLLNVEIDKVPHRYAWDKPYTAEIGSGTIPPEIWSYGPFGPDKNRWLPNSLKKALKQRIGIP